MLAIRHRGKFVQELPAEPGLRCGVVLDRTCFYAEQGGQVFDLGFMTRDQGEELELAVKNVVVRGGYVVHVGELESGSLRVGDELRLTIDEVGAQLFGTLGSSSCVRTAKRRLSHLI